MNRLDRLTLILCLLGVRIQLFGRVSIGLLGAGDVFAVLLNVAVDLGNAIVDCLLALFSGGLRFS
ncbi:hypothetical protein [Limosilactobacillus vaginalis]|uniref:hypothetical protein n=1 Tax=Limosilactobacillus vaginalis TaxID=1633 RepID=UPI003AAAA4F8